MSIEFVQKPGHCEAGPLVRTSYDADEQVLAAKVNV